jgi:hypothetical protein
VRQGPYPQPYKDWRESLDKHGCLGPRQWRRQSAASGAFRRLRIFLVLRFVCCDTRALRGHAAASTSPPGGCCDSCRLPLRGVRASSGLPWADSGRPDWILGHRRIRMVCLRLYSLLGIAGYAGPGLGAAASRCSRPALLRHMRHQELWRAVGTHYGPTRIYGPTGHVIGGTAQQALRSFYRS